MQLKKELLCGSIWKISLFVCTLYRITLWIGQYWITWCLGFMGGSWANKGAQPATEVVNSEELRPSTLEESMRYLFPASLEHYLFINVELIGYRHRSEGCRFCSAMCTIPLPQKWQFYTSPLPSLIHHLSISLCSSSSPFIFKSQSLDLLFIPLSVWRHPRSRQSLH